MTLEYKRITEEDGESLLTLWGDRDVIRYTNIRVPCTLQEIREKASTALHKSLSNSTRYLRQEHVCKARRRVHYAVASQTHT